MPGVKFAARTVDHSDLHMQMALEHFADSVDQRQHARLVSELMAQYVEVVSRLERSDAARREAQRIAQLGDWELDLKSRALFWSEMMYAVMEIDPSVKPDLEAIFARIHPDDKAMFRARTDALLGGNAPQELTYRLRMDDGRVKWILTRNVVVRGEGGQPISVHGTMQDITAEKHTQERLRRYNDELELMVHEKMEEIASSQMTTIYALVKLAESRDDETGGHIVRTSEYCRLLATKLREAGLYADEIDAAFIENLSKASPLHDIGKVGVPDAILLKNGKLTEQEQAVMRTHVSIGYETLLGIHRQYKENAFIRMGMDVARYRHERWDGGGYLKGLRGEEIPLAARIMALIDVYDALRSKRVYKKAFSHERAAAILEKGAGSHFDPLLVQVFLKHQQAFREIFDRTGMEGRETA